MVERRRLPETRPSVTHKLTIQTPNGPIDCYATVGLYDDGRPGELFLRVSHQGTLLSGFADALAMAVSLGLQYGVPIEAFLAKFRHMRFEPMGLTGDPDQSFASSLVDLLAGRLERQFAVQPSLPLPEPTP